MRSFSKAHVICPLRKRCIYIYMYQFLLTNFQVVHVCAHSCFYFETAHRPQVLRNEIRWFNVIHANGGAKHPTLRENCAQWNPFPTHMSSVPMRKWYHIYIYIYNYVQNDIRQDASPQCRQSEHRHALLETRKVPCTTFPWGLVWHQYGYSTPIYTYICIYVSMLPRTVSWLAHSAASGCASRCHLITCRMHFTKHLKAGVESDHLAVFQPRAGYWQDQKQPEGCLYTPQPCSVGKQHRSVPILFDHACSSFHSGEFWNSFLRPAFSSSVLQATTVAIVSMPLLIESLPKRNWIKDESYKSAKDWASETIENTCHVSNGKIHIYIYICIHEYK